MCMVKGHLTSCGLHGAESRLVSSFKVWRGTREAGGQGNFFLNFVVHKPDTFKIIIVVVINNYFIYSVSRKKCLIWHLMTFSGCRHASCLTSQGESTCL